MKSWRWNINGIFWVALAAFLLSACKTTEQKKEEKKQTLIKIHLESPADNNSDRIKVPVYRENPVLVMIDQQEILNNIDVLEAAVVDVPGGFAIRIAFDKHGAGVLENVTARNLGHRLVIYAAWPEFRWLAAPRISRRISDGVFIFTPDATREESDLIVKGINNVAKKVAKDRWP